MQNDNRYSVISDINGKSIPLGLGVALSSDLRALSAFSSLPTEKQNEILKKADTLPENGDFSELISSLRG